ncbi:MAG: CoA transferase [Alphaproteobacteria bacterium]|nr:CoA transferase [Alphaproteobacteria bacterium]
MNQRHPSHLPLSGLVAFELGHSVAAPYGAQILGELGARVIKVENPEGGDDARKWGPPFWHDAAAAFQCLNRDKQSIAVDLKDPSALATLRRLIVEQADIVLQNMRPGRVEKLGLDASLRRDNPRLIYCNLGAFGKVGPMNQRPGYDPLMQAFGGIMSITGEEGRPPVRVGPSIIDMAAGMWSVIGILAALNRRAATGEGCEVDTSLFETALAWMTVPSALYAASGECQRRTGSEAAMLAPYKAYKAKDDYIVIAAGNDNLFRRLTQALGKAEWADDPRFKTNGDRVVNRATLNDMVDQVVGTATRAQWVERLEKAGVPCAPIQAVDEMLAHPQTRALDMVQRSPDGRFAVMGLPLSFDGMRPPFRASPPALGQHTEEVMGGAPRRAAGNED